MVPFYGPHQAGIATPSQDYLQFVALDVVSGARDDVGALLSRWSAAAAAMSRGRPIGPLSTGGAPPVDTGESAGLGPARLTVTFGLGPSLFAPGRFGLAARRPGPLAELPRFGGDALQPAISGGDLGVQVCADDPQVAFHAAHELVRMAGPTARARWALAGFGRTSNSVRQVTPRNLMGFKDGTNNIVGEDRAALGSYVWARGPESPPWMRGGSYMVVRRIAILLGGWDATALDEQERTIGRHKLSGAPLGEAHEHDRVPLEEQVAGVPVIPVDAHIRVASPPANHGERILRRGYSYVDGLERGGGSVAGGQLFICYQRDPRRQFAAIQRRLARGDALRRHVRHVGSALFACPPGAGPGGYVGETLFG